MQKCYKRKLLGAHWCAVIAAIILCNEAVNAQTLTWLGTLPNYPEASGATNVSDDGQVVVGIVQNTAGETHAFRWTKQQGVQLLGGLGNGESEALDISADGSVVVGNIYDTNNVIRAFRWSAGNGTQYLGAELGGLSTRAHSISSNGSVVAVSHALSNTANDVYHWVEGSGMQRIGSLGGDYTTVRQLSSDGSIIVGTSENTDGILKAYRWTANDGMKDLAIPDASLSTATALSSDGSIITGTALDASYKQFGFRWSTNQGVQVLRTIPYYTYTVTPVDISADGSIIVGVARNGQQQGRAVQWTDNEDVKDLNVIYENLLSPGSGFIIASAISADGRFIVGDGYNGASGRIEGFLLDTKAASSSVPEPYHPSTLQLSASIPHPITEKGTISMSIPNSGYVAVKVLDVFGRHAMTIAEGEFSAGEHQLPLNVADLASGLYYCHVQAGTITVTQKVVVAK